MRLLEFGLGMSDLERWFQVPKMGRGFDLPALGHNEVEWASNSIGGKCRLLTELWGTKAWLWECLKLRD